MIKIKSTRYEVDEREGAMICMALGMLVTYLEHAPEENIQGLLEDEDMKKLFDSRNEMIAAAINASRKPALNT